MKALFKRICIFLMTTVLTASFFIGCGSKKQPDSGQTIAPTASNTPTEAIKLPIVDKPLTLTYFIGMDYGKIGPTTKNYGDMPSYKEIEKRTGIHVTFIHPAAGQETEQFNLMLASKNLPDMVYWGWTGVSGGVQKAIDDKIIISLNEPMQKYAPNLTGFYLKEPGVKKETMTDNGVLYCFPLFRFKQNIHAPYGFIVRQDWLDKLSLKVPTTIDEWYTVLKAFKEKDPNANGKADEVPFVTKGITNWRGMRDWLGAWGMEYGMLQVDNTVKFGPIQPEYKEYLTTMRQWYKDGLIDPDFATNDDKQADAKATGGLGGSFYGGLGDTMGKYLAAIKVKDPNVNLVGAPAPVLKSGDKMYNFRADVGNFQGAGAAITTSCKNVMEAVKWLDYRYSAEGTLLMNYGIENVSYKMVNGVPTLTELITKSPKGYSIDVALGEYAQGASGEAQFLESGVREQRMWSLPIQKDASLLWNKGLDTRKMPLITLTIEEGSRAGSIMNEVNTYTNEMFNKFVMGQEPLESFDKYVQTVKKLNIDESVKIYQAALDRYNKRK